MVVPMFSVLRSPSVAAAARSSSMLCAPRTNPMSLVSRNGGHGNVFVIRPTSYAWRIHKDLMHFYIILGMAPTAITAFFMNMFIGPAELAEIPDGYRPRHWEYWKHPLTRWFARYLYPNPIIEYEMEKWQFWDEAEKIVLRKIHQRARAIMGNRNDYQSWFYVPVEAKYHRFIRGAYQHQDSHLIGHSSYIRDVTRGDPDEFGEVPKDPVNFGGVDRWLGIEKRND